MSGLVIGAALHVHTQLGAGLLESIYEQVLCAELLRIGLRVRRQVPVPVVWQGQHLGAGFRADLIVDDALLVEIKAVEQLLPVHIAQVITYLKLTQLPAALLLNFNVPHLRDGIRRLSPPVPPSSL